MPSDRPEMHRGYLHKVLVNGAKAFRYRSGIRMLLGLPENPDAQLSYPLPLPPAGFKYPHAADFNEAETHVETAFRETALREPKIDALPKRTPFRKTDDVSPKNEMRDPRLGPGLAKRASVSEIQKAPASAFGEMRKPDLSDQKLEHKKSDVESAERMQIDIPGFSEKAFRFSALSPQKKEETPLSNETAQSSGLQEKIKGQHAPAVSEAMNEPAMPSLSPPSIKKNGETEKPDPVPGAPQGEQGVFKGVDPVPVQSLSEFKPVKRHERVENEIAEKEWPYRNNRTLISPEGAKRSMPRRQQAAEAQIEQLRQSLHTLKRKTASREFETQASQAQPETAETHQAPVQQPVVIVKHSPIQRRTPAAFWERRYLSRLFRVRPLR